MGCSGDNLFAFLLFFLKMFPTFAYRLEKVKK